MIRFDPADTHHARSIVRQIKYKLLHLHTTLCNYGNEIRGAETNLDIQQWKHPVIVEQSAEWQRFYNTNRSYSSLGAGTPAERLQPLREIIPSNEAILNAYDPNREWAGPHHFRWDAGPPRPR